ncbi:MAG: hypothetical protein J7623_22550 [Chitinophaga sp.]|uniref:hypothetical protein n=1 Tax=Chitinophaga sp. TaxID=1869181 RepID=UPI001B18AFA2|nr:hypothetical protein [Chitinophaga sp.]MBO9731438.1 hypothetical protein [Chitinophaga sp.]
MKRKYSVTGLVFTLFGLVVFAYNCASNNKKETGTQSEENVSFTEGAFMNHRDSVPSKQQYSAPLFVLSHDYPTSFTPIVDPPWRRALNGHPIDSSNVFPYMDSLKNYIAPRVIPFFTSNTTWTSAKYGWFNEPWLGSQREAILGAYLGNGNPANMFKTLKEAEAGYALVLYDSIAAYTVGQIWGKTGQKVNLMNDAAQFKEGSVIVKLAFSNVNGPDWSPMDGAQTFDVYDTIPTRADPRLGYQMRKVSFFQMDIIVKDSATSPQTGWVYSTFVYDKLKPGKSFWDKMVPLGAMWGNDPDVNSPLQPPYPPLKETIINKLAPEYSRETLGWGGRLSGPNDGAVAQEAFDINTGKKYNNLALSSCMSCHSPAQDTFVSFLLPGPFPNDTLFVYTPGSPKWKLWFRNNYGNVPFDQGQVAMDYDMVMAFKSVGAYEAAKNPQQTSQLKKNFEAVRKFRRHNTNARFWH